MFVSESNYKAYLNCYAYHYNLSLKEAQKQIEKNPQALEDYAEWLDNKGD